MPKIIILLFLISTAQVICDHPLNDRVYSDSIIVTDYFGPAMEGTTVTFQCQCPEYVLIGPNTTTCIGNGEWEPDPREVECKGIACTAVPTCTNCL